jgi:3-hydroxybutyryl-CoA dehydrogenase
MGTGIAVRYSLCGATVELSERDRSLRESAPFRLRFARHMIAHAASLDYVDLARAREAADRIHVVDRPGAALRDVDLVVEAIHDDVEAKHAVYRALAPLVRSDTVVASTTAALSIATLSMAAPDPERFLGWHWAFPSAALTYCEIIPAPRTSRPVLDWTLRVARRMGLSPTIVEEGTRPGFTLNRIWYAMMDEAREILAEGAASEDAIDRLYETSQRWPKGPCRVDREDADVVGADAWPELTVAAFAVPLDAEEFRPPELAHG